MPVNGSMSGGPGGRSITTMPTTIKPSIKKKPAPPRPPQPKINKLQSSMSFNTAQDFQARNEGFKSGTPGKDLIDFSTPPASPSAGRRNTVSNISTARQDQNEFSYRVGASIFYIKSPLKNSVSEAPVQNPFSPPRPTADTILSTQQKPLQLPSNLNSAWNSPVKVPKPPASQISPWDAAPVTPPVVAANSNSFYANTSKPNFATAFSTQNYSSPENNNTIKSHYQNQASWTQVGASSSSNASSDRNSAAFSDFGSNSQPRYSNVPAAETAAKKELSATLSSGSAAGAKKPTIIRPATKPPAPASTKVSEIAAKFQSSRELMNSIKNNMESTDTDQYKSEQDEKPQRNYYDVPPDEDDDDFDDDEANDSSILAPPMPSEPPPPPPPDVLAVDAWVSSTTGVTDYPDTYSDAGQPTAYAIALYDFFPEAEGDLQLQAGDLVYLIRKIDDQWIQGSCGGMEGIFPSNFVNVVVPLPEDSYQGQGIPMSETSDDLVVDVLYDFTPEADSDLGLQAGEKVKILGRINEDWLYGEKNGARGQFPAAFVQPVVQDLPTIKL